MATILSGFFKCTFIMLSTVLLIACVKEIEIDTSGTASKVVVSSFFTDTSPWNVTIYNTFNLNDQKSSEPITNASVSITGNSNTIALQHTNDGIYAADEYPETGVEYTLLVRIEGKDDISAQSSVPYKSGLSDIITNPTERSVVTSYGKHSDMISAGFTITPPNNLNALCRVRTLLFDTITGYNRYYFNEDSYKRMLENGVEPQLVSNLKILEGQIIFGPLWNVLRPKFGEIRIAEYTKKIEEATFFDRVDYRDPAAYTMSLCVARAGLFYQPQWEEFTLLGNFSKKTPVDVFISPLHYNKRSEHWLEFMDFSPEYYQYKKDYSLQISNRGNISGAPVLVFSNVKNGTGIFAGYQKQMFRLDNPTRGNSNEM